MRTWCVAVLLVCGTLAGPSATAAPCGRTAAARAGAWFDARPPLPDRYPGRDLVEGGIRVLRAAALDPVDPRVVVATDGTRVQRSDDGGCTWREVYDVGPGDAVTQIAALDVARVGGRSRVLLVLVTEPPRPVAGVARFEVVRSDDGVSGWTSVHTSFGLLTAQHHDPVALVRSGAGGTAYAVLPSLTGTYSYVRSPDGRTWQERTPPGDADASVGLTGIAVSPWNADEVWEWSMLSAARLRVSVDGAVTWRPVDPWPTYENDPYWLLADVAWPRRGGPARVVVAGGSTPSAVTPADPSAVLAWSGDGGATWGLSFPPKSVSLVNGPLASTLRGDVVLVGQDGTTFRVPHTGRVPKRAEWRRIAPLGPAEPTVQYHLGFDADRTGGMSPGVVLVPGLQRLRLLTVAP